MNRNEFLSKLGRTLKGMPGQDVAEILEDYREHFRHGLADNRDESDIAASLGDPVSIGKIYRADLMVKRANTVSNAANLIRATLAVVSLGLFNILFVAVPFLLAMGTLAGLWLLSGMIILTGLGLLAAVVLIAIFPSLFVLGGAPHGTLLLFGTLLSIGFLSMGTLSAIGMGYLTRTLSRVLIRYLKYSLQSFQTGGTS